MDERKLISGEFNTEEAREVLLNLIDSKIKFHTLKNFSAEERFGRKDPSSTKRLAELKELRAEIVRLLENNEGGDFNYRISSSLSIKMIPKQHSVSPILTQTVK
jgi:hypothetical protein